MLQIIARLPILVLMAVIGCSNGSEQGVRVISLGEPSVVRLQDDLLPLKSLTSVQYVTDDSFIALDQAKQVVLVQDGKVVRRIGVEGQGPCEMENPFSIATDGETVFVLDITKSAVLSHSLSTGECLRAIHNPQLQSMSGLVPIGEALVLVKGGLYSKSDPNAPLLYSLSAQDSLISLPVVFGDITTLGSPMPVRMSMPVRQDGNRVFFSINMATAVVAFDLATSAKSATELALDVPDGMSEKSPNDFIAALIGETEMLFDYYAIDGNLATVTRKTIDGTQFWFATFVGTDGTVKFVTEPIAEHITWVTDSEIRTVGPDFDSVDGGQVLRSYPYSLSGG